MRRRRGAILNLGYGRRPTMRNSAQWYRIENAKTPAPTVYIYDEIGYWGVTAGEFAADLAALDAKSIDVRINSPGGEVFDGIAIYNALLTHKATVNVFIDGLAASAASFIAQAGDSISMARNAQMMIHDAQGICIGPAEDMLLMSEMLNKCSDNIADIYAQRAGGTVASWRSKMRAETWYSAAEAVTAGLADSVVERDGSDGASNAWDLSIYAHAGRDKAPAPIIDADTRPEVDRRPDAQARRTRQPIDLETLAPVVEPEPAPVIEPEPGDLPGDPVDYVPTSAGAWLAETFHNGLRDVVGAMEPLPPVDLNSALRDVFLNVPEVDRTPEQPAPAPDPIQNLDVETWRQLMREVPAQ